MTPLEATARAREAVLAAVARGVHAEPDLVAVCEAAGGLCPRKGRALLRILARARVLVATDDGYHPGPGQKRHN